MSLKKCNECGKKVSTRAKECPECGNKNPTDPKGLELFIGIGLLVILIWIFTGSPTGQSENEDLHWSENVDKISAYSMTKEFVRDRLVSPSTAEFPGIFSYDHDENVEHLGEQGYIVKGYVDSQNRMGGTVRTHFAAEVFQYEEGKWELIDFMLFE